MPNLDRAARVGDPVEHTHKFLGGMLGAGLGIALGVAIVALTAPISLPALAAAGVVGGTLLVAGAASTVITSTVLMENIGEKAGGAVSAPNAGDIADGAHSVFAGPGQPKAARMSDPLKCHSGQHIDEGSISVFIENWNASRKGDATHCGGKIQDGCANVLIGGQSIGRYGSGDRNEVAGWWRTGMKGLDWAGTFLGFVSGKGELKKGVELALQAAGLGTKLYGATDLPGHKEVGTFGGALVDLGKGRVDLGKSLAATGAKSVGYGIKAGQSVVKAGNSGLNYGSSQPAPLTYGP